MHLINSWPIYKSETASDIENVSQMLPGVNLTKYYLKFLKSGDCKIRDLLTCDVTKSDACVSEDGDLLIFKVQMKKITSVVMFEVEESKKTLVTIYNTAPQSIKLLFFIILLVLMGRK
jgi:hypothetical protein